VEFPKAELETLWAPWRFEYFEKSGTPDFLSEAARASDDAAHLVLVRRKNSFLMMNRYPYTVGHLMAVPYRKVGELRDLGENDLRKVGRSARCLAVDAGDFGGDLCPLGGVQAAGNDGVGRHGVSSLSAGLLIACL